MAKTTWGSSSGITPYLDLIKRISAATGVPVNVLAGVMHTESGGNPNAKSNVGAMGLMQVMPFWFKAGENSWNSWTNVGRGTYILRANYDYYHSWYKAVASYYHGSLARFGTKIPTVYTSLVFPK